MITGSFAVVGGDMRLAYLAEMLAREGRAVKTFGLELSGVVAPSRICTLAGALEQADYVILPLPLLDRNGRPCQGFSKDRFSFADLLEKSKPSAMLFAGMVPPECAALAEKSGRRIFDYYDREDIKINNAVPAVLIIIAVVL